MTAFYVCSARWAGWARAFLPTLVVAFLTAAAFLLAAPIAAQAGNPSPPSEPVKLIFVHHSCGQNWLMDDHGGLGRALGDNNYFVSDTYYGWGPDGIGDRTDITDWPEWFTGPDSDRYLAALYAENGQLSEYTRILSDPGGENQVILFKSCYPNSNLAGKPGDRPLRSGGLTVSNAKAIYDELLGYFSTRPDKLFVAITAPPVQDPSLAANARAFNRWLVQDWLAGYEGSNVAVFDFYNVLTAPDNHHRFREGAVEYTTDRGGDTLYYPTDGDDHPSPAGNRKATEEFVPLLNTFTNRWQSSAPAAPPPAAQASTQPPPSAGGSAEGSQPEPAPPSAASGGVLAGFEGDDEQWAVFSDGGPDTHLACARDTTTFYSGATGLGLEYDIAPEGWASCSLVYSAPASWQGESGLGLYLRAEREGQGVIVVAYQGESSDELLHFERRVETNREAVDGWQRVDIPWEQFLQPEWQGDPGQSFDPRQALGLALLFDAPGGQRNAGKLWVDDVSFLSTVPPAPQAGESGASEAEGEALQPAEEEAPESRSGGFCPGSAMLGGMLLAGVVWTRGRRSN